VTFPVRDEIARRHMGMPAPLVSDSLLPWDAIPEIVTALRLNPGDRLLDLGCGRGSYGLEIARRTGAALTGVDFSEQALRSARALAESLSQDAVFRVADMSRTGVEDGYAASSRPPSGRYGTVAPCRTTGVVSCVVVFPG
jgi:2-polyprenyl-3-methyl-5-hydroxy-6-metoxy-1,4-benzoquinol methylase